MKFRSKIMKTNKIMNMIIKMDKIKITQNRKYLIKIYSFQI